MNDTGSAAQPAPPQRGLTSKIVRIFLTSRLSILFLLFSLAAGAAALYLTPREEEPQIVVPVADVFVSAPGASAAQVEKLVSEPLERLLWEIDGVEYVYSASSPGQALVTVRFYVGEDREDSLVKVWNKLMSNRDAMPPIVRDWTVKPVEIDDVPIVQFTLWSADPGLDNLALRRIGEEVLDRLRAVDNTGKAWVVGGARRQVRVELDPGRLAAYGLGPAEVLGAIASAGIEHRVGRITAHGADVIAEVGPALRSRADLEALRIAVRAGKPVLLTDVARIVDGPEEPSHYTRIGFGPAAERARHLGDPPPVEPGREYAQVTLAIAKRKGTNAVWIARDLIERVEAMRGTVIPDGVQVTVTRDYGETANHKVNELVKHLGIAIATIIVLLALALGPREALAVAIAVPVTLAVTLLFDLIFGYTINRVTLFALILSLGLLVDDPIVDVENIFRHFKLRREPPLEATLTAVDEVRPPTILATFTVIVSFLPMFFITGMMGPYMAPMAFNVPVAMLMSLVVAFTVTPWATYHLLKSEYGHEEPPFELTRTRTYRVYRRLLEPLLTSWRGPVFLLLVALAFVGSALLPVLGKVPLKMLPFDNKNEVLVQLDMPEGTPLERTDAIVREMGAYLAGLHEVTDYESYVGLASPIDFNGLVRHYYLRRGGHVADIRVNLLPKEEREAGSHEIALRIRPDLERIAARYPGAVVKVVELPPGPPVLSTLTGEIYGEPDTPYDALLAAAGHVRKLFGTVEGVVDLDDYVETPWPKLQFVVDRDRALQYGLRQADIAAALSIATGGAAASTLRLEHERDPVPVWLELPRALRNSRNDLLSLSLPTPDGHMVPLSQLVRPLETHEQRTIYHKNLERVAYVIAEVAGRSPVDAIFDVQHALERDPLPDGLRLDLAGEGEWKITLDVFRDLGIAFAAALGMIYVLLVAQTGSLGMPVVIMLAIPLTVIGIMPGFWLLNVLAGGSVAGYATPIFFTATGMIGMIALAGIVVRNSIILIDFIEHLRGHEELTVLPSDLESCPVPAARKGLLECVIEAGATRLRPIFLTAGAAMFGSFVITLDPIFSGLAWSFIFGIFASTLFTLFVIPVVYYRLTRRRDGETA
ncbi:MAG: efflux RND transporter permease subunit [Planctomycetota bacterium]|nr:MAG: efflux RND transporter permease subunit [Planctomycetota bacterium]